MFLKLFSKSALFALFIPSYAAADDYIALYKQPLEGVYFQQWQIDYLRGYEGQHEIYVRGEGKIGDFFGVLWLDCKEPRYSNWLASDGNVDQSQVPVEVIQRIRKAHC